MEYRYYIGLQLPPELSKRISQIQQELFDPVIAKKPLEPHITLLPPPAVERIEPEELGRQAKLTAQPFWPLQLTMTRVETFKDYAIQIRIEGEAIYELQKQLVTLLPPELEYTYYPNPSFSPHVTLSHAQRGKAFEPSHVAAFAQACQQLLPATLTTSHLTLFRWVAPAVYNAQPLLLTSP